VPPLLRVFGLFWCSEVSRSSIARLSLFSQNWLRFMPSSFAFSTTSLSR